MGLIAGIAAGVLGAGATAYGASQTPKPGQGARQATREQAQGTLQGYAQTTPLSYALSQTYQPAYLGLGSQNLQQLLFGTPEQTINRQVGWGRLNDNGQYERTANIAQQIPASMGLFDILGQAQPRLTQLSNQAVGQQLGTLNQYLPQAQQYYAQANPELDALRRQLGLVAQQNLALGGQLDPSTRNAITSQVQADWANRGLGQAMPAQLNEALQLYGGGEALRQARQQQAAGIYNNLAGTQPDYSSFILGLGNQPLAQSMQFLQGQQPLSYQGNTFDPYNPTAAGSGAAGMSAATQAALSNRDLYAGLGGGLLNLSGSFLTQRNQVPSYGGNGYASTGGQANVDLQRQLMGG